MVTPLSTVSNALHKHSLLTLEKLQKVGTIVGFIVWVKETKAS